MIFSSWRCGHKKGRIHSTEWRNGELGANWEGLYRVIKILVLGTYQLEDLNNEVLPYFWNF